MEEKYITQFKDVAEFTFPKIRSSNWQPSVALSSPILFIHDAVGQITGAVQLLVYVLTHQAIKNEVEFGAHLVHPVQVVPIKH